MQKKNILLAVSGGIAAYKAAELTRLLKKQGYAVRVVMTESATRFVTPLTFQALTGHPVHHQLLDVDEENAMGHINLARWAEHLLIAPATANIIAKMSHGLADDLLTTLYLAAECPVSIAPAMNQAMWGKSVTQQNIRSLMECGVQILGPEAGDQACGESGMGRMLEPEKICNILSSSENAALKGKRILISAGPTREAIDPVRFISNRSSGKMGYALAEAAVKLGATVTLVSGPVNLMPLTGVGLVNVESAEQMYNAIAPNAHEYDIYIGAAAVADYRPAEVVQQKIKKQLMQSNIPLTQNKDIIAAVAELPNRPFVVGFAAETDDLEQYARHKMRNKKLDMIAANWVGREQGGFDSDVNALKVFWQGGDETLAMMDKPLLAERLLELIAKRMHEKNTA